MPRESRTDIEPRGETAGRPSDSHPPPDELLAILRIVKHPFVVSHVTPDSDAIGSALGLATVLREHDVDATVGLKPGRIAKRLRFMLELAPDVPLAPSWRPGDPHDCLIVVDAAGEKRIDLKPTPDFDGPIPIVNIDHHITNTDFGRYNWVDPQATSTSELIARLIGDLGWRTSPNVASLLYAGIHGDTAGFSLPTTSARALHIAGDLVFAGADVSHIGEQLCRSQRKPDFELLRRVYDHATVTDDGRVAYSFVTYEDITGSKCTAEDIDDQVSIPQAVKDVRIAMLFSEGEPGLIRVNFRGEGRTTVVEIAQRFGGGGHTHAAGARIRGKSMEATIREVVAAAEAHLDSQASG